MTTGICPYCNQNVRVRLNGTVYKHGDCEGGDLTHPRRLPPENPTYCETCWWGDCQDCTDAECDCMHWCPTVLEVADAMHTCPFCKTPHLVGYGGKFPKHMSSRNFRRSCPGSGRRPKQSPLV